MNGSMQKLITNDMLPFKYNTDTERVSPNNPTLDKRYLYATSIAGGLYVLNDIHSNSMSSYSVNHDKYKENDNMYDMSYTKGGFIRNTLFPLGLTSAATALGLFTVNELSKDYNNSKKDRSKSKLKSRIKRKTKRTLKSKYKK